MGGPPIPPFADGSCPTGFTLDPDTGLCVPGPSVIQTSGATTAPLTLPEVDPKNAGQLTGTGLQDSGIVEHLWNSYWRKAFRLAKPEGDVTQAPDSTLWGAIRGGIVDGVRLYVFIYDGVITIIADWLSKSVGRDIPTFWDAIGALISDLLGVNLNGRALFQQLQSHGTLAAMQGVGAGLIDLLIGEFTGTATGSGGNVSFSSAPNSGTGLPPATLTPAGGVLAAKALMGFVLSSAVRQANVEGITEALPFHLGSAFEKYSEAMRTNLGIGRMLRFALRPLFQVLVADQMKQAMHIQYLPTLLNAAEAVRGVNAADIGEPVFADLLARAGYNPDFVTSLRRQHTLNPPVTDLLTLRAAGFIPDSDFELWLRRHGYSTETAQLVANASDREPARRVSLALAEHYLLEYGRGTLTSQQFRDFVDGLKRSAFLLTPGEVSALEGVANTIAITTKIRPRHLSIGQLTTAYVDGVISLFDFQQHLAEVGFSPDDVQIETEVLLIKAKAAADAAAARAAKAKAKASGPAAPTTGA